MTFSRKIAVALFAFFVFIFTSAASIWAQGRHFEQNELVKAAYSSPFVPSYFFASTQSIGSFPTFTGGFEDETVGTPATVSSIPTGTQQTAWTFQSTSGGGGIAASGGRSGPQYLAGFSATTSRRFQSPTAANQAVTSSTAYVVQFYYRSTAVPANFGFNISTDGTVNLQPYTVSLGNTAGVWTKVTQAVTSNSAAPPSPGYGILTLRYTASSTNSADFDDVVMYPGTAADSTAPNAPTSPSISSQTSTSINVGWTSPVGGVDGGGYMVVRGTTDPTTVPNANGIYKVGNTVAGGQTVAYIGVGTSFTDSGLTSGTQYFYRIYAVDKAFNYSTAVTTSASTTAIQYSLTVNAGTGGSITAPASSPITVNHGAATTVTALANPGYTFLNWTSSDSGVAFGNANSISTTVTLTSGNATVAANFADQTAPDTSIGGTTPANPTNLTSAAFTFSGSDAGSGVASFECRLEGGTFAACTSPKSYPGLAAGSHTFEVRAIDAVGNIDASPASFTWTIDTTAPTISYTPLAAAVVAGTRTLVVTASDNIAVASVSIEYKVDGGAPVSSGCPLSGGTYQCSLPGALSTAVSYTITANDTAGNSATGTTDLYTTGVASIPAAAYGSISLSDSSTLAGNISVSTNLDLAGVVDGGAFTTSLGCAATVTGADSNSYLIGNIKKDFCSGGTFTFPSGTPATSPGMPSMQMAPSTPKFSPVDITVTDGAYPSSLTVSAVDATLGGLIASTAVSRYWNITLDGTLTADLTFHYLQEDVHGTESGYQIFKRESGVTTAKGGTVNTTAHTASISGVSSFSEWGVGTALIPTGGEVSMSGRVVSADGNGIYGARIVVSGTGAAARAFGNTGPFGYFRIDGLDAGQSYVVTITSKTHTFPQSTKVITLNDSVADLVFVANP